MNTPIWTPTRDRIETSNMVAFMTLLGHRANAALRDYADLYAFSHRPAVDLLVGCMGFLWRHRSTL
jgi:hypothetical protein